MNAELLLDLARHQAWADAAHWKALRENGALSLCGLQNYVASSLQGPLNQ
jgi:hypothetical protein